MDKKPLTKGIVHWLIGGIQAFAFQIFLSCNLTREIFEIANETIPKPLAKIPEPTLEFEINISELPAEKELKNLFSQTTWASERKNMDIKKMLENLNVFVTIRENSKLIGFGRAISDGIYRALVDDIIVDNSYQNSGLGKVIVENILKQLDGIDEIFLNTKPDLEEFYKKFGFIKVNTLTMKKMN